MKIQKEKVICKELLERYIVKELVMRFTFWVLIADPKVSFEVFE